jgi:hypothetical protein
MMPLSIVLILEQEDTVADKTDDRPIERIVFMHIPKTAGTAVHSAFVAAFNGTRRICPYRFEHEFNDLNAGTFDYYSGHIGFDLASRIGGQLVTVLRDPVDRVLSIYYFFRHLYETGAERNSKTALAVQHDLPTFLTLAKHPYLILELRNRMTWQIAGSCELPARQAFIMQGHREEELLAPAIENLSRLAVFGLDTGLDRLARLVRERLGVKLDIQVENVTPNRVAKREVDARILRLAEPWVYLDQQLYDAAHDLIRTDP